MKTRSKIAAAIGIATLGLAAVSVHADAPDPTEAIVESSTVNLDSSVTVTLKFSWSWATHKGSCADDRYGVGYAVDWDDANGNEVITGVNVGVKTADSLNAADNTVHTAAHPCSNTGTDFITISHTYANADAAEAAEPCVVTYDLHFGDKAKTTVKASDLIAGGTGHNKDNSSQANGKHEIGNVCASVDVASGELTLVKVVNNGEGDTATIDNFLLKATGDNEFSIEGHSTDDAVTGVIVNPGDFDLSEEANVDGYTASDWDCGSAPVVDGHIVTVLPGEEVTCTITNNGPHFGQEAPTTLPQGGSNSTNTALAAIVLALLGGGLVVASRRRQTV